MYIDVEPLPSATDEVDAPLFNESTNSDSDFEQVKYNSLNYKSFPIVIPMHIRMHVLTDIGS